MGSGYSVAYEDRGEPAPRFSELIFPVYIIGLDNIIYHPSIKSMNLDGKKGYFVITKETPIKRNKIQISKRLTGEGLKVTLKKAGIVTKINDYYIFTSDIKKRVLIYDSHMNRKLFDYRKDSLFNFHLYETYDVYIF